MKYPVVSLFSGAMGLDLGLQKAGLEIVLSQDFNPAVGKTMAENGHNYVLGDIRELVENDPSCQFILDKIEVKKEEIFAVVGGPPCQSFSTAGKRLGVMKLSQERNLLLRTLTSLRTWIFNKEV